MNDSLRNEQTDSIQPPMYIPLFVCNGKASCGNDSNCYKNGGDCFLTPYIRYAEDSRRFPTL